MSGYAIEVRPEGKHVLVIATIHDADGVVTQSAVRVPGAALEDFIAKLTAAKDKVAPSRLVVAQRVPKLVQ